MECRRALAAMTLAFGIGGPGLAAESAGPSPLFETGARVRVTWGLVTERRASGRVLEDDGRTLVLRVDHDGRPPLLIDWPSVRRVEVPDGRRKNPRKNAFVGALAVGIPLALLATYSCLTTPPQPGSAPVPPAACGVVGLGVGGALGAAVGSLVKTEHWQRVPLPEARVGVAPQRGGGIGVTLSCRF